MNKIHFHSLDALRFFAFLKVYLLHIPIQGAFPIFSQIKSGGGIGVSFFFVLSGFLITYLLSFEKIKHDKINIRKFLIRRSLRIWPLFYLMVIIAFLLPYEIKNIIGFHMLGGGYDIDWRYSFTFLENYKMLFADNFPKTTPLSVFWSLCIEEHFYIFWIICLSLLPIKHFTKFLFGCIIIAWTSRFIEPYIMANNVIVSNDLFTNLDYFAFGGILGFWVAKDYRKVTQIIQNTPVYLKRAIVLLTLIIITFQNELLPYHVDSLFFIIRPSIIALLFTLLIAVFIPENSIMKIKSRVLNYLGKISYGLYVYHIIFIHITFQYFIVHDIKIDNWMTLSIFMCITLTGSIISSMLSYHYFEYPFLQLRDKLTKKRGIALETNTKL